MTSNYTPEKDNELYNYVCDQTVILDCHFLKNIVGIDIDDDEPVEIPDSKYCYPFVNSIYQYGEDYDAVSRIPHLLHDRESRHHFLDSCTSILQLEESRDQYMEETAQQQYLNSKPTSFIILGKPGIGEKHLGLFLADLWKCAFIHPELLIEEEVMSGSRAGMCIEYNLRCGRSISIDVIMRLLEKRLRSKSVQHRGFVICGFPLLANNLYIEDPVSSESAVFNVNEIFDEMIEHVFDITQPHEAVKNVSMADSYVGDDGEDNVREVVDEDIFINKIEEDKDNRRPDAISVDVGSTLQEICYDSKDIVDYSDQMNFIFKAIADMEYIIVYIKCENDEVVNSRSFNRCDGSTLELFNLNQEMRDKVKIQMFGYPDIADENYVVPNRKMLKLQRDYPKHVRAQLDRYRYDAQTVIEKYILLANPERVVRLDGRLAPHRMFQALKLRLRVLPITQCVVPELLVDLPRDEDLGEIGLPVKEINWDELSPEEWYNDLSQRKTVGKLFKWALSDWGFYCPVQLEAGNYVLGNPKFAVHFMNKIFFLSDYDSLVRFTRNPRMYLRRPNPKPKTRIFIIGPCASGRTSVAGLLQTIWGGNIVEANLTVREALADRTDEILEEVRKTATREAYDVLKKRRRERYETEEENRLRLVDDFIDEIKYAMEEYMSCWDVVNNYKSAELTSLPVPKYVAKSQEVKDSEARVKELKKVFKNYNIPLNSEKLYREMLEDESLLYDLLPEHLQPPIVFRFELIGPKHPFVVEYLKKRLEEATAAIEEYVNFGLLVETYIEIIEKLDQDLATTGVGWIINGLSPNPRIMQMLFPKYMATKIYILNDGEQCEFVNHRLLNGVKKIYEYTDFFRSLGMYYLADKVAVINEDIYPLKISSFTPLQMQKYEHSFRTYHQDSEDIMRFLTANDVEYTPVVVTNKTQWEVWDDIMCEIMSTSREKAYVFTADDRAAERDDYFEGDIEDEELGGEGIDTDKEDRERFFRDNRRIGDLSYYCPVTYKKHNVLWLGKEELMAKYINKLYFFSTASALEEFLLHPHKYILYDAPKKYPPPRICVTGIKFVGKTKLAHDLSHRLGYHYLDFETALRDKYPDEIDSYLKAGAVLPDDILHEVLHPLWFKEPMQSTGFIIDGFPRRASDLIYMCEHTLIPEMILYLSCEDYVLNERILGLMLEEWRVKIDKAINVATREHRKRVVKWKRDRMERGAELMQERRDIRYNLKLAEQAREREDVQEEELIITQSLMSYKSVEEAEDVKIVETLLNDQFPEPILIADWESLDAATERLQQQLNEVRYPELTFFHDLQERCEIQLIPWITLDASLPHDKIYNLSVRNILPMKYRNKSIFERVYDVSVEIAEKLLECGYYFLSRFGKTCPVQIFEDDNQMQMFIPLESRFKLYPLIHRSYIYFIAGPESREQFRSDPLKYVCQQFTFYPLPAIRLSVIGPPRSSKTTIAERIQSEYGLKHISIGKAVRYVLKYLTESMLYRNIEAQLRSGEELTNEMNIRCVEAMSYDPRATALGMIYDGFPNSVYEVRELARWNLVPNLIIDLRTDLSYIHEYMDVYGPTHRPEYSKNFIALRYREWQDSEEYFRTWMDKEYQNIAKLTIEPSKWKTWTKSRILFSSVIFEIKHYYKFRNKDIPSRITNMLVTPLEFLKRKSSFKAYCPCCLFYLNSLTYGGEPPDRTGLLQYRDEYYYLCPEHIEEFIDNPWAFLDPNIRHSLPPVLPMRVRLIEKPENAYGDGYCITCCVLGKPNRVFHAGLPEYAVEYGDWVYLFDTEACLDAFMVSPSKFSSVPLNIVGYDFPPLDIQHLPTLGLLEQYVASEVVKAVIKTNALRPFIPGLDVSSSAMICLGLFLKINNKNTPKKYLSKFKESWALLKTKKEELITRLEIMKKTINSYLHYEEPFPPFQIETGGSIPLTASDETSDTTTMVKMIDNVLDNIDYGDD